MFDEEAAALPGPALLLAAGDNVGASPPNSALLEDMPTIDVENAWGLDATSLGNHEFDYGVDRAPAAQARANFPFLSANIVETATGKIPPWLKPSKVFRVNGVRVGVIGAELQNTPGARGRRRHRRPGVPARGGAHQGASRAACAPGVKVQVVVIHEGTATGDEPDRQRRRRAVGRARS